MTMPKKISNELGKIKGDGHKAFIKPEN